MTEPLTTEVLDELAALTERSRDQSRRLMERVMWADKRDRLASDHWPALLAAARRELAMHQKLAELEAERRAKATQIREWRDSNPCSDSVYGRCSGEIAMLLEAADRIKQLRKGEG